MPVTLFLKVAGIRSVAIIEPAERVRSPVDEVISPPTVKVLAKVIAPFEASCMRSTLLVLSLTLKRPSIF